MALPDAAAIGSVTLVVSDLERSLRFYEETLGFGRLQRHAAAARLSADGTRTLVELRERRGAARRPQQTAGLFHVAILVPSRAALGRSLRRLANMGWPLTGVADHLVSEALYLDDPDGLGIEIYRDRPRESWTWRNGQVAMTTEALDVDGVMHAPGADKPWRGLDPETVIGHVHLQVPDLASAESFYCGEVGFAVTCRGYHGALFVSAGGYHHHVGLNTWRGVGVPPPPPGAAGLEAFTIVRAGVTRDVVDEATAVTVRLRAAGASAAHAGQVGRGC